METWLPLPGTINENNLRTIRHCSDCQCYDEIVFSHLLPQSSEVEIMHHDRALKQSRASQLWPPRHTLIRGRLRCGHRAPLNWLGLLSSMICGHVGRSSGSTCGRSHYCPYWEPCHFIAPLHSGRRTNRAPPSNNCRMLALAHTATGQGTVRYRETSQRDEGDEACLQNKHPETGPACRSREDP